MWFGGLRIDSGAMPIGNLTAFLQYVMQILFAVMMADDHVRHGAAGGGVGGPHPGGPRHRAADAAIPETPAA